MYLCWLMGSGEAGIIMKSITCVRKLSKPGISDWQDLVGGPCAEGEG